MTTKSQLEDVRSFWNANPLCAAAIPHPLGSSEYFSYYNQLREANESPAFSAALHEYDQFAGKQVLDVGCGNGYVLEQYAKSGAIVTGIDLTPAAVSLSRERFRLRGLQGTFHEANAEELPFADNSFDCVCSMGVLHHTPHTERAVREVHRVLKRGGRLIMMFYHRNSFHYRIRFTWRRLRTGKSYQEQVNEVDGIGNPKGYVYSKRELACLLNMFTGLEMFAGLSMLPGKVNRLCPSPVREGLERRWGWFLYAKGWKP